MTPDELYDELKAIAPDAYIAIPGVKQRPRHTSLAYGIHIRLGRMPTADEVPVIIDCLRQFQAQQPSALASVEIDIR